MINRRLVVQSIVALVTGSALAGTASSASDSETSVELTPYDAGSLAHTETTIGVSLTAAAVDSVPVQDPVQSRFEALTTQFNSLSTSDLGRLRGSLAVQGSEILGGGVVIDGAFDRSSLQADIESAGYRTNQQATASASTATKYYQSTAHPYAIGVDSSSVVVGYGRKPERALSHAKGVAAGSTTETTRRLQSMADMIGTNSLATAILGKSTQNALEKRIPEGATAAQSVLQAANTLGFGIDVNGDTSRLVYGVELEPKQISLDLVWEVAKRAEEGTDGLELDSISNDGWTAIGEVTAPTAGLWGLHEQLLGIDFE